MSANRDVKVQQVSEILDMMKRAKSIVLIDLHRPLPSWKLLISETSSVQSVWIIRC